MKIVNILVLDFRIIPVNFQVEICIRGQIRLLDINEALPVKCKKSDVKEFPRLPIPSSLPKPQFQVKQSYNKTLAPKRAASYFRYIEKSLEELDQEVNVFVGSLV